MREDKFKAWDKNVKKWIDSDKPDEYMLEFVCRETKLCWCDMEGVAVCNGHGFLLDECGCWEFLPENRFVIVKWTGLHDKNGTEIYEGDVLSFPFVTKSGEVKLDMIGVVKYGHFGCYEIEINANEEISNPRLGSYFKETVEVIGNIYENPELMEEKK